jgi:hypothetical protein
MPQLPDFPVNIILQKGTLRVVPDCASVSRGARNSVVWHCVGCWAEIIFENGSPFLGDRFVVPPGGFVGSGPAVFGDAGQHFKYKVVAVEMNGGRAYELDPEVVVEA